MALYRILSIHSLFTQSKVKVRINGSSHSHQKTDRYFPIFHSKTLSENCIELNCMAFGTLRHFPEFPNNFPFEKQMKFVRIIYQTFLGIEYLAIKVIKMSKTNEWIDIALGIRIWGISLLVIRHKCYRKFSNILQLAKQINRKFLWTSESHQFCENDIHHGICQKRVEIQEWLNEFYFQDGIEYLFNFNITLPLSVIEYIEAHRHSFHLILFTINEYIFIKPKILKMAINRLNFQRKTGTICLMVVIMPTPNAMFNV